MTSLQMKTAVERFEGVSGSLAVRFGDPWRRPGPRQIGSMLGLLIGLVLAASPSVAAPSGVGAGLPTSVLIQTNYDYPYRDPYLASATLQLIQPSMPARVLEVPGLAGRERVPLLEGRSTLELLAYVQKGEAPLIFLVPGLGGTGHDGGIVWLAENLFRAGHSVIIVPSPLSWMFILAQSASGVAGYTPEDVDDLRRLMGAAKAQAESRYGLRATRIGAAGYSLGAVNVAFLLKQEREDPKLGLERVVMINPPLHIPQALGRLDHFYDMGAHWSPGLKTRLNGLVMDVGMRLLSRKREGPSAFYGLEREMVLSPRQFQYVIGETFRRTLGEAIFTGHQIRDLGLLKSRVTKWRRTERHLEALSFSFSDYMVKGVFAYVKSSRPESYSLNDFIAEADLRSLQPLMARDSGFRLLHNMDDFLVDAEELKDLARRMGDRAILYPLGGHVGNLWHPRNVADFLRQFADLKSDLAQ